jgi:hypothetical protein
MFTEKDGVIHMVEKDFGVILPIEIEIEGTVFDKNDKFSVKIFEKINENPIISKEYGNIQNNTIEFMITEEESSKLQVGNYFLDIDWYQEGAFLGNIIKKQKFRVDEKAGG